MDADKTPSAEELLKRVNQESNVTVVMTMAYLVTYIFLQKVAAFLAGLLVGCIVTMAYVILNG